MPRMVALSDELNPAQLRAVQAASPLLILAGAGTGKTHTLAHRVARLLGQGTRPERILLLTFSRRAACEMTRRARRLAERALGGQAGEMPWAGTFHAIASRLLRQFGRAVGL